MSDDAATQPHDAERDTSTDAATRSDVHTDTLTTHEAAALLGRSEGTVRRLIRTGQLPAVEVEGERGREYRLRVEDVQDVHGRVNAYTTNRVRAHERVDRVDASPETALVRVDSTAGMQALIDQVVRSATEPLTAELAAARVQMERLDTENGRLQAENERLQAATEPPAQEHPSAGDHPSAS